MQRLRRLINRTLSVRLSLMVVSAMAMLLMASLAVMLHFSRKTLKEEALHKASQTLEGTVGRIDNILMSVEQTACNCYFSLLPHIGGQDKLLSHCRRLVESNPYVTGCAIAFRPGHFPGQKYFMAYVHRNERKEEMAVQGVKDAEQAGTSLVEEVLYDGEYIEQPWYSRPMMMMKPGWQKPMTGDEADEPAIVTFCFPLTTKDKAVVGILGVGVSLTQLSRVIGEAKPSENSFCMLLDADGTFIVHPSGRHLTDGATLTLADSEAAPSMRMAVKSMLSGKSGYKPFSVRNTDYYVFYKPYKRSSVTGRAMEEVNWSAGIVYPEADIFGDYDSLLYYVLAITVLSLLLLFLLCRAIFRHQLTPLVMLAEKAQRLAEEHHDELIPDNSHSDEIARLQHNFRLMQQSLAANIGELEQLTTTLQERGEGLRAAYNEAKKADRMKTAFLHNMTNQMLAPATAIDNDVSKLCAGQGSRQCIGDILRNGNTIAELLNNLINMSDDEKGGRT